MASVDRSPGIWKRFLAAEDQMHPRRGMGSLFYCICSRGGRRDSLVGGRANTPNPRRNHTSRELSFLGLGSIENAEEHSIICCLPHPSPTSSNSPPNGATRGQARIPGPGRPSDATNETSPNHFLTYSLASGDWLLLCRRRGNSDDTLRIHDPDMLTWLDVGVNGRICSGEVCTNSA